MAKGKISGGSPCRVVNEAEALIEDHKANKRAKARVNTRQLNAFGGTGARGNGEMVINMHAMRSCESHAW